MSVNPELERDVADEEAAEIEAQEASSGAPRSMADLIATGDVDGLMQLAKAHRAGSDGMEKDLAKAFACYDAAAKIGSAAADYSVALFYLNGGSVVAKDPKEAAAHLRSSAEAGYTPAKIYLANMYEQGIYYRVDPSKADVWYRSAARSANVKSEPGALEYRRAMAEIGAVRYCLEIVRDQKTSGADKLAFLRKAKAFGYRDGPAPNDEPRASEPDRASQVETVVRTIDPLLLLADRSGAKGAEAKAIEAQVASAKPGEAYVDPVKRAEAVVAKANAALDKAEKQVAKAKPKKAPLKDRLEIDFGDGLIAFFFATVLMGAGFGLGHALTYGGTTLLEQKAQAGLPALLPIVGPHVAWVLPILVGVVGFLPALVMYRLPTWGRALVVAIAAGIGGEVAWTASHAFVATRLLQWTAFGASGFLAALLVLGIFGGTRSGFKARHLKKLGVGAPLRIRAGLDDQG